jgi:hypothetical protein
MLTKLEIPSFADLVSQVLQPDFLEPDFAAERGRAALMSMILRYMSTAAGVTVLLDAACSAANGFGPIQLDRDYRERNNLSIDQVKTAVGSLRRLSAGTGWLTLYEPERRPVIVTVTPEGLHALRYVIGGRCG